MRKTTLNTVKAHFEQLAIDNQTTEWDEVITELTAEITRAEAKAAYKSPADIAKAERSAALYDAILEIITNADAPLSVTNIREAGGFTDSPQKITNVVTRLVNDGKVIRTYDKRKATYTLA